MPPSLNFCIIVPVHNRRETTLACLRNLRQDQYLSDCSIVVVDDGSTDQTAETINSRYPDVTVLHGDGSLWWGGAMHFGMTHAYEKGFEYIVWLNDDCFPEEGCLKMLIENSKSLHAITVCQALVNNEVEYGGHIKHLLGLKLIKAIGNEIISCHTMAGNCVCVPRWVVKKIGGVNARRLPHSYCDVDYGLRATAAGIPIFVIGPCLAQNLPNDSPHQNSWLTGGTPLYTLWKGIFQMKSMLHFKSLSYFYTRHWGLIGIFIVFTWYAKLLIFSIIRLLVPIRVIRALRS